jgi:hypothetical protein
VAGARRRRRAGAGGRQGGSLTLAAKAKVTVHQLRASVIARPTIGGAMSEHAPRAERANGTGRSRRVTTTSDFSERCASSSKKGLRASVIARRRADEEGAAMLFRLRATTTPAGFERGGLRAAVLDERASRHAYRRRASEEGSGSQRKPRERSEPDKTARAAHKEEGAQA